jgi:hypothetical protein
LPELPHRRGFRPDCLRDTSREDPRRYYRSNVISDPLAAFKGAISLLAKSRLKKAPGIPEQPRALLLLRRDRGFH